MKSQAFSVLVGALLIAAFFYEGDCFLGGLDGKRDLQDKVWKYFALKSIASYTSTLCPASFVLLPQH